MKNLRFSSHPRAKVRRQGPPGSARAQPCFDLPRWVRKRSLREVLNEMASLLRAIAIFELHQATICKAIDMKMIFFLMEIELIFTTKVLHLVMFWKWEFLELRNAPLKTSGSHLARLCSKENLSTSDDEEVFCTHTHFTGLLITKLGNFRFSVQQKPAYYPMKPIKVFLPFRFKMRNVSNVAELFRF